MARISQPVRNQQTSDENDTFRKMLTFGGAAVGGILGMKAGGPGGAVAGASTGANLGGTLGGMIAPSTAQNTQSQSQGVGGGDEDSAIARRLAASRQDRLATLRQAEAALPLLSPELREQYAPAIVQATMAEERQRAMGRA